MCLISDSYISLSQSDKDACLYRDRPTKANGIARAAERTKQTTSNYSECLSFERHEINGNYYATENIRSKTKAHARNSECSRPLQLESSLNENSACLEMEKTSFQPASVLPDCRAAHLPQDCSPVPSLPCVPQVLPRCSSWVRTVVRRAKGPTRTGGAT